MNLFHFKHQRADHDDIDADNVIEGERDAATADRGLRVQNKVTNLVIIASVVTVAGFVLWRYYAAVYNRHTDANAPARESMSTVSTSMPPLKPPVFPEVKQEQMLPPLVAPAGPDGATANQSGSPGTARIASVSMPPLTPAQQQLKRRLDSPLAFKVAETQASKPAGADAAFAAPGPGVKASGGEDRPASSAMQVHPSGTRAYMLAAPSMMITQGTKIPCNVVEAINTTLPGLVTCVQADDVRGADGKVVLLERGTRWVGRQANGIDQGQRRVGIVWSRGETPNHVLVDVDSGGADWLGRPGIPGDVDNHFWDRFGAAILLSVISDVGPYLNALRQGGGNNNTTIAFPNITGGAQQVMSDVLKSTMNIQSTLTAPQASQVVIHVEHDLDFRDVYALHERQPVTQ